MTDASRARADGATDFENYVKGLLAMGVGSALLLEEEFTGAFVQLERGSGWLLVIDFPLVAPNLLVADAVVELMATASEGRIAEEESTAVGRGIEVVRAQIVGDSSEVCDRTTDFLKRVSVLLAPPSGERARLELVGHTDTAAFRRLSAVSLRRLASAGVPILSRLAARELRKLD